MQSMSTGDISETDTSEPDASLISSGSQVIDVENQAAVPYNAEPNKLSERPPFGTQMSYSDFLNRHRMPNPMVKTSTKRPRTRRRLVYKNGLVNIEAGNVSKRKRRYLIDIFTTLIDIQWRWLLMTFVLTFASTWLTFATAYFSISYFRGDLNPNKPPSMPCIREVSNFTTALLFSIETQQTIGYGFRHMTDHCPEAVVCLMFQCCIGSLIHALMTGIVFAKLSRPKRRSETVMFSRNAVICMKDGALHWMVRVGDMRRSHLVDLKAWAVMIKKRVTKEGEVLPLHQFHLKLKAENGSETFLLTWPILLTHHINNDSPLWKTSRQRLLSEKFEIILILEGIVESTGMTAQMKTSYLPEEVLWGHRFKRLVSYQKHSGVFSVDFKQFHETVETATPQHSARTLAKKQPYRKVSRLSSSDSEDSLTIDEVGDYFILDKKQSYLKHTHNTQEEEIEETNETVNNTLALAVRSKSPNQEKDSMQVPTITIDYASDSGAEATSPIHNGRCKRSHSLRSKPQALDMMAAVRNISLMSETT